MILRELDNELYEVVLAPGVSEDEFLEKQKNGTIKFIQINQEELPVTSENEQRYFSKVFYKLNSDNIVIDYDRTVKLWIEDKYKEIENFIYSKYQQAKQASDQADKEYYTTLLKAKGIDNLEAVVVAKVQDFFNDVPLENLVDDVVDEDKEAYIQLIKVGIRVTWVQMCKQELKLAITENREPKFPEYPL